MTSTAIAWFSVGFVAALWVFLIVRIFTMWRRGIAVLTVAPKKPLLNALGVVGFLALLVGWSGVFVYVAFFPSAFVPFRPLWDTSAGAGPALIWAGVALALAGQCLMWAAILTMGILFFIWTWNDFLLPLVVVSRDDLRTLPLGLTFFQGRYSSDLPLLAAGATMVALPTIVVYVLMQRHFIRGLTAGAVK